MEPNLLILLIILYILSRAGWQGEAKEWASKITTDSKGKLTLT